MLHRKLQTTVFRLSHSSALRPVNRASRRVLVRFRHPTAFTMWIGGTIIVCRNKCLELAVALHFLHNLRRAKDLQQ